MSPQACRLELARDVHWRVYADGIVFYVAETCQTHLLPTEFGLLIPALRVAATPGQENEIERERLGAVDQFADPADPAVRQLIALGIFKPAGR